MFTKFIKYPLQVIRYTVFFYAVVTMNNHVMSHDVNNNLDYMYRNARLPISAAATVPYSSVALATYTYNSLASPEKNADTELLL